MSNEAMEPTVSETETVQEATPIEATTEAAPIESAAQTSWRDSIPEDLRDDASLKDITDAGVLAKNYVHAQKMLGSSVRIPGEDAGPEDLEAFYSKLDKIPGLMKSPNLDNEEDVKAFYRTLGTPEDSSGYQFEPADDTVKAIMPDLDDRLGYYKDIFHKANLTTAQAKVLYDNEIASVKQQYERMETEVAEGQQELKRMWGDDYSNRKTAAESMIKILEQKYPDQTTDLMNTAGRNPVFVDMLAQLAQSYKESGHVGMSTANFGTSPDEARAQISEIRNNKSHAYHNPSDPNHSAALAKVQQLYRSAYPSE